MNWITNIFCRRKLYNDLSEEIQLHIEEHAEHLVRQGMSAEEAAREARRAFGNRSLLEERSREVWQLPTLESIWSDVRFALRQMRRSPGFAVTAMLTLAFAIGANAVVFGVLNKIMLHPLEVPGFNSLYAFETADTQIGHVSYPDYLDFRARNHSFEDLAAFGISQPVLDSGTNPSRIWSYETTGNYFDVLRIRPYLGRVFHANDERGPNSAPYMVLTYAYWRSHFQADRGVIGRVVLVNKHPFTVIGVTPPGFEGSLLFFSPDCFVPIVNRYQIDEGDQLSERGTRILWSPFGHLKPGVTQAQALADLTSIGSYLETTYPKENGHKSFALIRPGFPNYLGRPLKAFVAGLMLAAGLILLAACVNLGGLFAARAADRSRELALRLALGSSRKRILRQLLTEALLISFAGGAAGLVVSVLLLLRLNAWQPFPEIAVHVPASPDGNVCLAGLALALISGLLFGIVPVRQVLQASPFEVVKGGLVGKIARRITLRDALLVVQIAICAVLVTSSLVAVRGLVRSLHGDFGFELRNAMVARVELKDSGYTGDSVAAIEERMIAAMKTIPGIGQAALVSNPPLVAGGAFTTTVFKDETADLGQANIAARPFQYQISPEYFHAAGTSILSGRSFTPQDTKDAPSVAVINQEFAKRLFGSERDALGKYFKTADGKRRQVVGIVEDGKYFNFSESQQPAMFLPISQTAPLYTAWLVVRSPRDSQQLAADMRSQLRALDAGLPVQIETWTQGMDLALFPARMAGVCLGVMGLIGAMLSITGIFGMSAYTVSMRLKELGIRVALGAKRREVLAVALGRALKLLAFGSIGGLLVGVMASRILAHIVYQASPRDPLVLAGVVMSMSLLALLATWIPAQRALSADPLVLLRED